MKKRLSHLSIIYTIFLGYFVMMYWVFAGFGIWITRVDEIYSRENLQNINNINRIIGRYEYTNWLYSIHIHDEEGKAVLKKVELNADSKNLVEDKP